MNSSTAQAAAAQGVGTAMERIADYYLAMAENIFPVIEIDAMREIDFIVNRGMKVTLSSADALTQVSLDCRPDHENHHPHNSSSLDVCCSGPSNAFRLHQGIEYR